MAHKLPPLQPMQIIVQMEIANAMESWIWELWQSQKSLLKKTN
jgi:hypothetical protein